MPATLRLTGSGVNAVGGEEAEGVSGLLQWGCCGWVNFLV